MKLKDLKIKYLKGKPPRVKEGRGLVPYLTPEFIRNGATPEFYPMQPGIIEVNDGELILLWDGSNAGEFFRSKAGILSSTMVKIERLPDADDRYFFYSLKLQEPKLKAKTSGSGIPHVDKYVLLNLDIYLPNKVEQSTIANILNTIDQAIEKTEQLIAKYERVKTGLMQDLLTCGIDEKGNIRSEETHEFKDSPLGRIPKEWEIERIDAFLEKIIDYRGKTPQKVESGIPLITARVVRLGYLDDPNEFIPIDDYDQWMTRGIPREGDVLFTTEAPLGNVAQVPKGKVALGQRIITLQTMDKLKSDFLFYLLMFPKIRQEFLNLSSGSTVTGIKQSQFRRIKLFVPEPEEQSRIICILKKMDSTSDLEISNLKKLRYLKTGLMQDLLTGKVRVDALIEQMKEIIYPT